MNIKIFFISNIISITTLNNIKNYSEKKKKKDKLNDSNIIKECFIFGIIQFNLKKTNLKIFLFKI